MTLDPALAKAQTDGAGGRSYYERFEGMRVRVAEATANSGGTNKFGELFLTLGPEQDRVFRTDAAQDLIAADSDAGAGNPPVPYLDPDGSTTTIHADLFDHVSDLVGPMSYDFSNYRVVTQPDVVPAVDRTPGPAYPYDALSPSAPDELRIASFNVENFFGPGAVLDGGIVTDADYAEKRDRIADAIDRLLERPDVVAVQEVDELAILQDVAARARRVHRLPARGQRRARDRRRVPGEGHRDRVERAPVGQGADRGRRQHLLGHPRAAVRPPAALDRRRAQRSQADRLLEPLRVEVRRQPGLPRRPGAVRRRCCRGGRGGRRPGARGRRPERLRGRGRADDAGGDAEPALGARARAGALLVPVQRPPADARPHVRQRRAARPRARIHVRALRQRLLPSGPTPPTATTSPTTTRRS